MTVQPHSPPELPLDVESRRHLLLLLAVRSAGLAPGERAYAIRLLAGPGEHHREVMGRLEMFCGAAPLKDAHDMVPAAATVGRLLSLLVPAPPPPAPAGVRVESLPPSHVHVVPAGAPGVWT